MREQRGFLQIVNWRKTQKYLKINPPWIKLFTSLFSDDGEDAKWQARQRWEALGAYGQALLVNLWLYAATTTTDGRIWWDVELMREVLPYSGPLDLGPLLAGHFVAWVAKAKAEGEGEGEAEGEAEAKGERESQSGATASGPSAARAQDGTTASSAAQRSEPENQPQVQAQGPAAADAQRDGRSVPVIGNGRPPPGISAVPPSPPVSDAACGESPGSPLVGLSPPAGLDGVHKLGDLAAAWLARTVDPVRDAWVKTMFEACRFPFAAESQPGKEQTGAFGRLYERLWEAPLDRVLSDAQRQRILGHDLKTAREKARCRGTKKIGAVVTHVHYLRLYECLNGLGRDDIIRAVRLQRRSERQNRNEKERWWRKP